jgi:GH18 family chitinase
MNGSAGSGGAPSIPAVKFVVYLDDYTGTWTSWAGKIDFSKMTHLNLAFFAATSGNDWKSVDGQSDSDIKAVVDKAHAAGVKVLASLGGGGTDTTVSNQYKNPANDDMLVSNLDAFLKRLNLDGADIDIEKESTADVGPNYGTFVAKVIAKLHPEGKLVTAAVAQYLQGYMPDDTLLSFDFVNIMIYSSNMGDYTSALNFYVGKGMAKTKLTLGLISESGQHTSVATTKTLTTMSKSWGGAMLWDLAEDATGSASVYKAMQDTF